ncbi:MAG: DUF262 domain-containing protein [Candidatus Gastranaerophilales bacterium]|nr:DUF262 domain-containing protein [Candidatus Gastranaerophilales bacterium]
MNVVKNSILDFLSENNAIDICTWQRDFVWDKLRIDKLYNDVVDVISQTSNNNYFFGTIILKDLRNELSSVEVIDGKQRLIAINLFICALCDYFEVNNYKKALLFQKTQNTNNTKLKIYNSNGEIFENIIGNKDFAFIDGSLYAKVYKYFYTQLEADNYNSEDYFNALKRFEIACVHISEKEDALLYYENANTPSINLDMFDRIKTFVLIDMNKQIQSDMVKKYWDPLKLMYENKQDTFLDYLICYTSMQSDGEITKQNVFSEFYKFYNLKRKYKKSENILPELYKFAQYYIRIKNSDFTQEISAQFDRITALTDNPKLYSFLFEITDDFQNNLIPMKVFVDILENIANNIEQAIANNQEIEFSGLSKEISRLLAQKYE